MLDDHPLVREWLAGLIALEPDLEVCGQSDEATAAFAALGQLKPDLAVVDLSLPRSSGLEFLKQVKAEYPEVRLLVLSMHDEVAIVERAFRAGAHGYAIKRESGARIIAGIRAVLHDGYFVSQNLAAQLAGRMFSGTSAQKDRPEEALSDREMEVFRLRGQGLSLKEISDRLGVSAKTVGSYDARIKEKLGLANVGELVRQAVLWNERQKGLS